MEDLCAFIGLDDAFDLADEGVYGTPGQVTGDALAAVGDLRARGGVRTPERSLLGRLGRPHRPRPVLPQTSDFCQHVGGAYGLPRGFDGDRSRISNGRAGWATDQQRPTSPDTGEFVFARPRDPAASSRAALARGRRRSPGSPGPPRSWRSASLPGGRRCRIEGRATAADGGHVLRIDAQVDWRLIVGRSAGVVSRGVRAGEPVKSHVYPARRERQPHRWR